MLKLMPNAPRTFNSKHLTFDIRSIVNGHLSKDNETLSMVRKANGFTLIELLIVISIIGVLASLTLASYGGAQAKARDGVRKSDLAQMKRALELAKSDCQGSAYYPNYQGTNGVTGYNDLGTYLTDTDLKYISSAPTDPKNASPYQYGYRTNPSPGTANRCPALDGTGILNQPGGDDYSLWAVLERTSDADGTSSRTKCNGKPVPSGGTWTDVAYAGYYVICNN